MLEDPNLIRRPIVIIGSRAVFGYRPDVYDEIIG
jgi:arsenate reductase-like glutaredoxin family protein